MYNNQNNQNIQNNQAVENMIKEFRTLTLKKNNPLQEHNLQMIFKNILYNKSQYEKNKNILKNLLEEME